MHPGERGGSAPHIEKHVPAEIGDAELAKIEAENGVENDPGDDDADLADDPVDDLEGEAPDDPGDEPEDHPDDDPGDEADSEVSVGDPLRYLPPLAAAKWLRANGLAIDIAKLRRLVAEGAGPAVGHFSGRLGGWRVRFDQLQQWAEWERFRASWQTRQRAAA